MVDTSTNDFKYDVFDNYLRGAAPESKFHVALVTNVPPVLDATIEKMGDLTEIAEGNGYTSGGIALNRDNVDFPVLTKDDAKNEVTFETRPFSWLAVGGLIPISGNPATHVVLTGDDPVVANRKVLFISDMGKDVVATEGTKIDVESGLSAIISDEP